jgi:hypothetical protein
LQDEKFIPTSIFDTLFWSIEKKFLKILKTLKVQTLQSHTLLFDKTVSCATSWFISEQLNNGNYFIMLSFLITLALEIVFLVEVMDQFL